jgi:excinuclease UvrABC ATPase subunit
MPQDRIVVRGAREHNLKNIDVAIPRDTHDDAILGHWHTSCIG